MSMGPDDTSYIVNRRADGTYEIVATQLEGMPVVVKRFATETEAEHWILEQVEARRERRLWSLVLEERPLAAPSKDAVRAAMLDGNAEGRMMFIVTHWWVGLRRVPDRQSGRSVGRQRTARALKLVARSE